MIDSAWATAILAAAGLTGGYSAGLWRGGRREGAADVRLQTIADRLEQLVLDKDRVHAELVAQMREDRQATNERLTYLERYVWPVRGRHNMNPLARNLRRRSTGNIEGMRHNRRRSDFAGNSEAAAAMTATIMTRPCQCSASCRPIQLNSVMTAPI